MSSSVIIFLFVLCLVLVVLGIVGSVVPALPGPPLSLLGMVACLVAEYNGWMLLLTIFMFLIVVMVTVFDFLAPGLLAKKGGGGKWAGWGANIGLIIGLIFFPLIGLVLCPFVGALIGAAFDLKLWENRGASGTSLRVAGLASLALFVSTFFKVVVCVLILVICVGNFLAYLLTQ